MTQLSFSDNILNFSLPESWNQLSQKQLRYVFFAMNTFNQEEAKVHILMKLLKIKVHRKYAFGWKCSVRISTFKRLYFVLKAYQIAYFMKKLDYIYEDNTTPVRLDKIKGLIAVDKDFHGVEFGDYVICENLYQGWLATADINLLKRLALVVYKKKDGSTATKCKFGEIELVSVFIWISSVKMKFAKCFRYFFSSAGSSGDQPNMVDIMNAEIRALTGGDITKEDAIMKMDCWRALTELDMKTKEAKELKEKMKDGK